MSADKEYIYGLYYDDFASPQHLEEGLDEVIFYIGRTKKPATRLKQHRYEAKRGLEDKYVFIRELNSKNVEWDLKILKEVDPSDGSPWEYWHVIEAIRQGSPLKNMRYGDMNRISASQLNKLASDKSITDVNALKKRLSKINQKAANGYSASEKLQKRAIFRSLRWLRTESDERGDIVRQWDVYDLGDGTNEFRAEQGMKKTKIAALLTPESQKRIDEVMRKIS